VIIATASQPSFYELLTVGFRYKRAILTAFLLPMIVAVGWAYSAQKLYQADSKVIVRAGREYVPVLETGDRNAMPPSGTMQEAIDTEVEILTSKDVLEEVVDKIGIGRLYPALAGVQPPHPILTWLSEQSGQSWPLDVANLLKGMAATVERGRQSARNLAVAALAKDLKVTPVKLSNVIQVSVRNPDPVAANETLHQLLATFQVHHVAAFNRERSPVLEDQIRDNLAQISRLENTRATYRNNNLLFAVGEQRTALIQQEAHDVAELQEVRIRQAFLQEQVRFLGAQLKELPHTMKLDTATQPSAGAQSTERSLQELKAKEGLFATRFKPDSRILLDLQADVAAHQEVVNKSKSMSTVRSGLNPVLPTLEIQLLTARSELAPLGDKGTDLAAAVARIDEQLQTVSMKELPLLDLDRKISQLDLATNALRQRLEDSRFLDELDHEHLTSVTVIENSTVPEKPVAPRKILYGAAGLVCGFITAACVFLIGLTFCNRFLSVDMVERVLGVPVVAVLPLLPPLGRRGASLPLEVSRMPRRIGAR
jgi:polysaccharide biosynthesis protein PslE